MMKDTAEIMERKFQEFIGLCACYESDRQILEKAENNLAEYTCIKECVPGKENYRWAFEHAYRIKTMDQYQMAKTHVNNVNEVLLKIAQSHGEKAAGMVYRSCVKGIHSKSKGITGLSTEALEAYFSEWLKDGLSSWKEGVS